MDSNRQKVPKAKLPRKRRKAAIKAQGRKWYYDTIKFFNICQAADPDNAERVCRFWVNASIRNRVRMINGVPVVVREATRYW